MAEIPICRECGVPEYHASEHLWLNSGCIVQRRDQRHQAMIIETDILNVLFHHIEEIIGMSIDSIVRNTRRRASRAYADRMFKDVRELVQENKIQLKPLVEAVDLLWPVLGYGRYELLDYRYEQDDDDYADVRISNTYSITIACSDLVGAYEAITGNEYDVTYEEVSPDVYEARAFRTSHPEEFKGRLNMKSYSGREGDIEYDWCSTCGVPKELSSYRWDLEKGILINTNTGRREVFFAPAVLDAVFDELERELGETIPDTVIEAQRNLTVKGQHFSDQLEDERMLRRQLALQGLGDLRKFKLEKEGLSLCLDSAAIHLVMVGLAQGIYERTYGLDSAVEWKMSQDGDLEVEVAPS